MSNVEYVTQEQQLTFPWAIAEDSGQRLASDLLDFYDPHIVATYQRKIFPNGSYGLTKAELLEKIHYYPFWLEDVFGDRLYDSEHKQQAWRENEIAVANDVLYSSEIIKLAVHINGNSLWTKRPLASSWYTPKPATHPIFFLNFLRFSLAQDLFHSAENALDFIAGDRPQIPITKVFERNEKYIHSPQDLPSEVPLALIHGRFATRIPHPDHEKAIEALAVLKKSHPDLIVIVAIDPTADSFKSGNDIFGLSVFAEMSDVDYVMLVDYPYDLEIRWKDEETESIFEMEDQQSVDAFYAGFYRRIFQGRKSKFLYVNPYYPKEFKNRLLSRCEKMGIKPVGRAGGVIWSSTLLYGYGRLPETIISPRTGRRLTIGNPDGYGTWPGDPEEAVLDYWEYLAEHIAMTYSGNRNKVQDLEFKLLYGT